MSVTFDASYMRSQAMPKARPFAPDYLWRRKPVDVYKRQAKYRVYIIDEVHMLSIGAFNALLKTLEEPPSYVLFILATTEVHKLPAIEVCRMFSQVR